MAFLAVFEPEIPYNIGALVRLSVCFGTKLVLIRPFGFIWDIDKLKRTAMDYFHVADIQFFDSFDEFAQSHTGRILGTAIGFGVNYFDFDFKEDDCILLGKESVGLPKELYAKFDNTITIPIASRSLNLSTAGAILLSHAQMVCKVR